MKYEVKLLLSRALDAIVLAIEHFNRPYDRGRTESTLAQLNHSFEMLMKAAILHRGGRIWKKKEQQTLGFNRCINVCLTDPQVRFLNASQATTLRLINGLRDAAEHYVVVLSEPELYACTQAGVTLMEDILRSVFEISLADSIPTRVLPVSTAPPKDLYLIIDSKFSQVKDLVAPGRRKKAQARAAIRSVALMDRAVRDNPNQPNDNELDEILTSIAAGRPWQEIFPGIAGVNFALEGSGLTVKLRITKAEGVPVMLVGNGAEASTIAVKRVNEVSYYSLGLKNVAEKVDLGPNVTLAVIRFLKLQEEPSCFKEIVIGKSRFRRYSPQTIDRIREALPGLDVKRIWKQYGSYRRKAG